MTNRFTVALPTPEGGNFLLEIHINDDRAYAMWLPYLEQLQQLIDMQHRMGTTENV